MENLSLVRVTSKNSGPFLQYVPGNMQKLLETAANICVGAVYGSYSCGAALVERENDGGFYLRSIFIDPVARLCGMGTYLLRGITGEVQKTGVANLKFVYSPSLLECGTQSGIFKRAGFRVNNPVATSFSIRLGDIKVPDMSGKDVSGVEILRLSALPDPLQIKYIADADSGAIPPHADIRTATGQSLDFCTLVSLVKGEMAGIIINTFAEGEIVLRSLYIYKAFRRTVITGLLIDQAKKAAEAIFSEDDVVRITSINTESYSLCEKLFRNKYMLKETEFIAEYSFDMKNAEEDKYAKICLLR